MNMKSSDGEPVIYLPGSLRNIVLVEVLLGVVPSDSVERVLNLKHHGREGANCRQVRLFVDRLVIGVEHEGGVGPILLIKAAKNEDRGRSDLVGHG